MRICFLAAGNSIHTKRWLQYFSEKGHEIHLISLSEYTFEPMDNVKVYLIASFFQKNVKFISFPINMLKNILKARKLIRIIKPDIVHAHYVTDHGLIGYFVNFPLFVVTAWGSDIFIDPHKNLWNKIFVKLVLNSAKLITCNSNTLRNECLKYTKHSENLDIILWGVDLTKFLVKRKDRTKTKKITVLSTRSVKPLYNIDSIIRSIPYVIGKYPNVTYTVLAVGTQESELRQLASSLNVSKYVEFVNKNVEYSEIPLLLNRADIFVSVPSSDSFSNSLLEAMACGLPVIVSDIPANYERITDGWNGFIVPARNPEKLADSIIQMIEKPDLMQLFGERNAQIIRDCADQKKHMAHMENLYKQLIEKYIFGWNCCGN